MLCCLLPFAACFFLGTGIGVGVGRDENPWVDIVLFGLIAGNALHVAGLALVNAYPWQDDAPRIAEQHLSCASKSQLIHQRSSALMQQCRLHGDQKGYIEKCEWLVVMKY